MKIKMHETNEFSLARMIHWCATTNCKCAFFVNQIVIRYRTLALLVHICHFQKSDLIICHNHFMIFFSLFHFAMHETISFVWSKENERPITVWCVDRELEFFFYYWIEKADDSYAKSFQMSDCKCSWSMKVMHSFWVNACLLQLSGK